MLRTTAVVLAVAALALGRTPNKLSQGTFAYGPNANPIGITPPNFPGGEIAVDAPPGPFFVDFKPPFPTDSWWAGFTVSNQNADAAGPFPFQSSTTNTGLVFGIGDERTFDGTSIKVPTQKDWTVGIAGLPDAVTNRKCTSFDTQTVCLQYFNGAGATMDSCLVPGSPYMTFKFTNAAVLITSNKGNILSFAWMTPGTKARVTHDGGTYLIYVVGGTAELTAGTTTITSPPGFSGTLRFAKVIEPSQEAVLDQFSSTYATGLTMSYTVAGDVSTQTWTWDVVGTPANLLLLSWPHHRKVLQAPQMVNIEYLTLKGRMIGVQGNSWIQRHNLPTISWFAETDPHPSCLAELEKTLEWDVDSLEVMIPGDFYFWGGAFGRAARMALIAEHIGRTDLVDRVVAILKQSVSYWFDGTRLPVAAFETGWGGFINKEGWNNTWVDFGNAYYNDHHFHYGYLMEGAATIGKYDPAWLTQHMDFFVHVARDYGNPSPNDPHYTVTRHMDFFAGHSWASGIANGAGGRDQESSGEAINGYYGLLLFANAIQNQDLIDWARLVLAMEIEGAKAYWHLYPKVTDPDSPYPEQGFRELITIGNVMDWQAGAWLFWGAERIQIAAIQILPLTPIGQETFDKAWMEEVVPYCQQELDDNSYGDDFKSIIYAAYSVVNPQSAYSMSSQLSSWGSGNSASNQLYFVSTQKSTTDICAASAKTPEGLFNIQDAATGMYVTLTGTGSQLSADAAVAVLGTKFRLGFTPGGGNILALSNNKYVTASPGGNDPLSAVRDTQQSYEVFRWAVQPDGTYELTAMVNRAQVSTQAGTGNLINNVNATVGTPSKYRLVPAESGGGVTIPPKGVIKSVSSGKYVVHSAGDPKLYATVDTPAEAVVWNFVQEPESPPDNPYFDIQSGLTQQYVTADVGGTVPLAASRPNAAGWETFQFVQNEGSIIIVHVASGKAVGLQPDNTLIDNNESIDATALWEIIAA